MQRIRVYKIGREVDDIIINDQGVSRVHAELIELTGGRYYLTDCNSVSGTFIFRAGSWEKIRQDFVLAHEIINVGKSQYTAPTLISLSRKKARSFLSSHNISDVGDNDLPTGEVKRNTKTGDILKKNE